MRRGIVVVAPAWHSCGSYEVFKSQVETFRSLGYVTYFLAVSRKAKAWKHPAGYWEHYLKLTQDIAPDFRGQTGQSGALLTPSNLRNIVLPALAKSIVTWRALPAMLAPIPQDLRDFIAGCDHVDIVCNHYFNLPIAERLKALKPGCRLILETHDIQSRQFLDQNLVHPVTQRRQSYDVMLAEEVAYCRRADILVHLNEDEAAEFAKLLPEKRHELIFPMVRREAESGETAGEPVEPFDFLIVMSGNHSNYASLVWFLEEVWTEEFDRKFSLKIVGVIDEVFKARNSRLYHLHKHSFVGRLPSLGRNYEAAGAILIPMMQGHGISIKTIEAMAYGKRIFGTRGAFRGFENVLKAYGDLNPIDTAERFRNEISEYANRRQPALATRIKSLYDKFFSFEGYRESYCALLDEQCKTAKFFKETQPHALADQDQFHSKSYYH